MAEETYAFVKETKRDVYWDILRKELGFLVDPETGGVKAELAKPVATCLLCESAAREELFRKGGFRFLRCRECDFIYADPQINEEALFSMYRGSSSNDAWIEVLLSEANFEYDRKKYNLGLDRIEALIPWGRLLDIGSSIGHFLHVARGRGWETVGLEMNTKAVAHARGRWGIEVIERDLRAAAFAEGSFQAVTLWGVIEHLQRPLDVLGEVNRILVPGGVLLCFCPNVDSVVCRVLHEKASTFNGRNHCGYFSPGTISRLLDKCGFETREIESFQPGLDTVLNYLDFKDPYLKDSKGKNTLRELLGQGVREVLEKTILHWKRGYKIMVVARKAVDK